MLIQPQAIKKCAVGARIDGIRSVAVRKNRQFQSWTRNKCQEIHSLIKTSTIPSFVTPLTVTH